MIILDYGYQSACAALLAPSCSTSTIWLILTFISRLLEQIGHSNIAWTVDGYDISTVIKSMHNLIKFLIGHECPAIKIAGVMNTTLVWSI